MLPFRLCSEKQSFCLFALKAFAFLPSNTLHYNALDIFEYSLEPCRMHETVMPKQDRIE